MLRGQYLLVGVVLLVFCLLATGCLLPYAFPKLSIVPGCDSVGEKTGDVYAFRVDVTADQIDAGETGEYTITDITPGPDGRVPAQARLTVERGFYVLGIALNYNVGRLHTTRVRLYRPGYQLVELKSWEATDRIDWQPAADWKEQEKAIDDLLRRPAVTASGLRQAKSQQLWFEKDCSPPCNVAGVNEVTGTGPRATNVFGLAVGEYERVAGLAPTPEEAARLRGKAEQLMKSAFIGGTYACSPDGSGTVGERARRLLRALYGTGATATPGSP
jgi:hypothetical protein